MEGNRLIYQNPHYHHVQLFHLCYTDVYKFDKKTVRGWRNMLLRWHFVYSKIGLLCLISIRWRLLEVEGNTLIDQNQHYHLVQWYWPLLHRQMQIRLKNSCMDCEICYWDHIGWILSERILVREWKYSKPVML